MKLHHYDNDGRARFITFCTHHRIPILTNTPFREIVVSAIKAAREQFRFRLIVWVIMPEHIHLILVPSEDTEVGKIVGKIKRQSARQILAILTDREAHILERLKVQRDGVERHAIWQRRCFDHNIRSDKSLWEKVAYCHYNPVKRGLVRRPEDWEWGSYRSYFGQGEIRLEIDEHCIES